MNFLSIIQKYLLYILLLACTAGAGFTLWYYHKAKTFSNTAQQLKAQLEVTKGDLDAAQKALKIAQGNLEATEKSLKDRTASLSRLKKEKDRNDASLKQALKANPGWSDAPLPDGVLQSVLGKAPTGELPGDPSAN